MKLSKLLRGILPLPTSLSEDPEIPTITCHTGSIIPGALWICIPGHRISPLSLLSLAAQKGALAAVIPKEAKASAPFPLIPSENIRRDAALLFQRFYHDPDRTLRLFGVTGTNGKTTTASILAHLLKEGGISSGMIGSTGAFLNGTFFAGTETMTTPPPEKLFPLLAALRRAGARSVVLEVSSQALVQERVFPLAFEGGIFTNLSREHLDYHGSMEEYAKAKARLFQQCRYGVFHKVDPIAPRICAAASPIPCGEETEFRILCRGESGARRLRLPHGEFPFSLSMPGEYNEKNALLAAAAAHQAGIPDSCIAKGIASFPGVRGRMETISLAPYGKNASVVIDYAHTPEALRAALEALRPQVKGRLLLLFGCGGERDQGKRAIMGCIAAELADLTYVTSDNCRSERPLCIIKDILSGMPREAARCVVMNRRTAIERALAELGDGDLLLLAGKGHETYEIDGEGFHHFDEREIVISFLERQKSGNNNPGGKNADSH